MQNKSRFFTQFSNHCCILSIVMAITQFLPFWDTSARKVSIAQFIWFPSYHPEVTDLMRSFTNSQFPVNDIVIQCILMFLLSIAAIIIYLCNRDQILIPICALISGEAGVWCCAANASFRLGGVWILILVVAVLQIVAGVLSLMEHYQIRKQWKAEME